MGSNFLKLWAMVAEHSHKTAGQICAAISKKKRKKIIFLQKLQKSKAQESSAERRVNS